MQEKSSNFIINEVVNLDGQPRLDLLTLEERALTYLSAFIACGCSDALFIGLSTMLYEAAFLNLIKNRTQFLRKVSALWFRLN